MLASGLQLTKVKLLPLRNFKARLQHAWPAEDLVDIIRETYKMEIRTLDC